MFKARTLFKNMTLFFIYAGNSTHRSEGKTNERLYRQHKAAHRAENKGQKQQWDKKQRSAQSAYFKTVAAADYPCGSAADKAADSRSCDSTAPAAPAEAPSSESSSAPIAAVISAAAPPHIIPAANGAARDFFFFLIIFRLSREISAGSGKNRKFAGQSESQQCSFVSILI